MNRLNVNPRQIATVLILIVMLGAPWSAAWLAFSRDASRATNPAIPMVNNPLWSGVERIGRRMALDLSAYQQITPGREYEVTNASVFTEAAGSFDVVIIGDSSASWGLLEDVVRQVSGLKVGVFAYESLLPNKRYFPVLDRVARRALRSDGTVVLFLSEWTIGAQPHEKQRFPTTRALAEIGQRTFERQFGWGPWEKPGRFLFSSDDLAGHHDLMNRWIDSVPVIGEATLPRLHVEPIEGQSSRKPANRKKQRFGIFRWETTQAVLHRPENALNKRTGNVPSEPWNRPVAQINAQALKQLPGKLVYTVPLSDRPELAQTIRGLYANLYADGMELADLPRMVHPMERIDFNDRTHVANLGALKQSILLGEWLRRRAKGLEGQELHAALPIDTPAEKNQSRR